MTSAPIVGLSPDHCVWITGASSGIGQALARAMAQTGRSVVVSARREDALTALTAEFPHHLTAVPLDITDAAAVSAAIPTIEHRAGPIGLAILNAGTYAATPGTDFHAGQVRALIETNVMGTVHCLDALLPPMRRRQSGRIAIVASAAGYRGLPTAGGYCASKAALIALAESLRTDLMPCGVTISVINPGFVATPLTDRNAFPMPDIVTADDAARAILAGLASTQFETAFPPRFAAAMKLLRVIPDRLFFPLMRRVMAA